MAKLSEDIVFLDEWENDLMNDEFAPASVEDVAFMLYAAKKYCRTGEKTNFAEVFNKPELNAQMKSYYPQIDKIINYRKGNGENNKKNGNQSYDNEAVKALVLKGFTQKEICRALGYDESKSRSLSTNKGYREGSALFAKLSKEEKDKIKSQKVSEIEKLIKNDSEITSVQSVSSESENIKNESVQSEINETDNFRGWSF